jgi:hypothetical protein
MCAASSTGYVYRFDPMTRLAVMRWKIGSIVDVIPAASGLLCLTSSHIILFEPETGNGSLSYFEGASKGQKAAVRAGIDAFYVMSHGQGFADIGVYDIAPQQVSAKTDGRAEAAKRVFEVAAAGSRMKALDSIQVSFVVPECWMRI